MTSKASKVTADTAVSDLTGTIKAGATLATIEAGMVDLTALSDAMAARDFTRTIEIKREAGRLLTVAVKDARTAGNDKAGKASEAITFAHVTAALNVSGLNWSFGDRTRSTLSDDLNAFHDATPSALKAWSKLSDADRVIGTRELKAGNAQHFIQWAHANRAGAPKESGNRASGAQAGKQYAAGVKVSGDARKAVATTLANAGKSGGEAVTTPIKVKLPDGAPFNGKVQDMPDMVTPAWLAGLTAGEIAGMIIALEGERKRRAIALNAGKTTGIDAPAPAPAPLTVTAVDEVSSDMPNAGDPETYAQAFGKCVAAGIPIATLVSWTPTALVGLASTL